MDMATARKIWTLQEVHSLPDDGNKYEVVRGELFVTPPPTDEHETIAARLTRLIDPFVSAHGLGLVYRPRAVMRFEQSEVEPDLMVRQPQAHRKARWETASKPILIVEVLSDSTRRRDHNQKKDFYMDAGVAEYWIVDPDWRTVTVVKPGEAECVEREQVTWSPAGTSAGVTIQMSDLFGES
jgi:Uma2 family endonuclease